MYKFENLRVWRSARHFVKIVYKLQNRCPIIEKYGLLSQLRRAATSVPLNIAEGQSSNSDKEFIRYLRIARGSLYEVVTILYLLEDLYCVNVKPELIECQKVIIDLSVLIRYLRSIDHYHDQPLRTSTCQNYICP